MTRSIHAWGAIALLSCGLLVSCSRGNKTEQGAEGDKSAQTHTQKDLSTERQAFKSRIIDLHEEGVAPEPPADEQFLLIQYPAEVGNLHAYFTLPPMDKKKHPAMIWITGGDCNTIGDVWSPSPPYNDQTASAYRKAGMAMMFPSLRGGNDNPGKREGFLGEVNDVISAFHYLKAQEYVDTSRIYLGGHSTGGTMALLVAESFPGFAGVFAFGPVGDVAGYGDDTGWLPFDLHNREEVEIRSPEYWLHNIKTPTWVLEGDDGNIDALLLMEGACKNRKVTFINVREADHFSVLAPTNALIASKIMALEANATLTLDEKEVNEAYRGAGQATE